MKLLVGLGNPGNEYAKNRHNVGFMLADFILEALVKNNGLSDINYKLDKYSNSDLATVTLPNTPILIAKPHTFMNKSGFTVAKLMMHHKIKPEHVYVAHDDLDIPIGKFKIQNGTGPKLHNGLESIENAIGKDFWRIRIGVENRSGETRIPGEAFVLQNFTEDEKEVLKNTFGSIFERLQSSETNLLE